jgi:hypothetical protein
MRCCCDVWTALLADGTSFNISSRQRCFTWSEFIKKISPNIWTLSTMKLDNSRFQKILTILLYTEASVLEVNFSKSLANSMIERNRNNVSIHRKWSCEVSCSITDNKYPQVPIAHAAHVKELHDNNHNLLEHTQWDKCSWHVWRLDSDRISSWLRNEEYEFCYFLCEWDSHARKNHLLK